MNAEAHVERSAAARAFRELLDGPPAAPSDARLRAMAVHALLASREPMPPAPAFDIGDDPAWLPERPETYLFLSARRMGPEHFARFVREYIRFNDVMTED